MVNRLPGEQNGGQANGLVFSFLSFLKYGNNMKTFVSKYYLNELQ